MLQAVQIGTVHAISDSSGRSFLVKTISIVFNMDKYIFVTNSGRK